MSERKPRKQRKSPGFFTLFLLYFLAGFVAVTGFSVYLVTSLSRDLPSLEQLEKIPVEQQLSTVLYSRDGTELRSFHKEKRYAVSIEEIPQCMIDALLATEDSRFYEHWGASLPDIMRAFVENLKATRFELSTSFPFILDFDIVQGGSTITQQLSRDLFLNRETSYRRKFREMLLALKIERTYSKSEILEFFLNKMFFGNNSYGIEAASLGYFGKPASRLELPEAAMLAGILQSPSYYNPRSTVRDPEVQLRITKNRRDTVLRMMANKGKISHTRAHALIDQPIELRSSREASDYGKAPYFTDYVRNTLESRYGEEWVTTSGATVETTLDYRLQQIAERILRNQLDTIQTMYANSIPYVRPPNISNYEAVQDSLRKTQVQGALVAMDVRTGAILALVGGRKYSEHNQFNRAVQATRQAGSSFKPFIYTAALDNGWRTSDTIYDGYFSVEMPDGSLWEPQNFDEEYDGLMSIRDGFKMSQNIISAKLVNDYDNGGIGPGLVAKYARMMGITTPIPEVPSISVGVPEVKLLEMVSAYTIFPNFGIKTENFAVQRILDKNNVPVQPMKNEGVKSEVLKPEVASLMTTMLRSVVEEGTASIVIRLNNYGDRPAAGKTGTAQEFKDTWFIGFTPYLACGVWIGFDAEETTLRRPLHTGAVAALPVWRDFIKESSELLGLPPDEFQLSNNLTTLRICRDSYKRATSACPPDRVYTEYYIPGTELQEYCDQHGITESTPRTNTRFNDNTRRQRRGP